MEREQHKLSFLELKLSLILDPIKSLVFGEINSKRDPQVSENSEISLDFTILHCDPRQSKKFELFEEPFSTLYYLL